MTELVYDLRPVGRQSTDMALSPPHPLSLIWGNIIILLVLIRIYFPKISPPLLPKFHQLVDLDNVICSCFVGFSFNFYFYQSYTHVWFKESLGSTRLVTKRSPNTPNRSLQGQSLATLQLIGFFCFSCLYCSHLFIGIIYWLSTLEDEGLTSS